MTFPDIERLTYLTDFFGLPYYNLEIWNRFAEQFKSQFDELIAMYNEVDIEKAVSVLRNILIVGGYSNAENQTGHGHR